MKSLNKHRKVKEQKGKCQTEWSQDLNKWTSTFPFSIAICKLSNNCTKTMPLNDDLMSNMKSFFCQSRMVPRSSGVIKFLNEQNIGVAMVMTMTITIEMQILDCFLFFGNRKWPKVFKNGLKTENSKIILENSKMVEKIERTDQFWRSISEVLKCKISNRKSA